MHAAGAARAPAQHTCESVDRVSSSPCLRAPGPHDRPSTTSQCLERLCPLAFSQLTASLPAAASTPVQPSTPTEGRSHPRPRSHESTSLASKLRPALRVLQTLLARPLAPPSTVQSLRSPCQRTLQSAGSSASIDFVDPQQGVSVDRPRRSKQHGQSRSSDSLSTGLLSPTSLLPSCTHASSLQLTAFAVL